MKRQKPSEGRQAYRRRDEQPRGFSLSKPEIWQVATEDFGERRDDEQRGRGDQVHCGDQRSSQRYAAGRCPRVQRNSIVQAPRQLLVWPQDLMN